ncbi:MAG: hypothetical protein WB770_00380 [Acidimicrobiales bacterium]
MTETRRSPIARRPISHPRFWRGLFTISGVGAVVVLLAACGGAAGPGVASLGSTTTTTNAVGTASPSPFQGINQEYSYALNYAECMRTHGVPQFPDPTRSSRGGFSFNPGADSHSPRFSSANSACKHLLPDNGGPPTAAQIAVETSRLLQYAHCMRTHGEPNFSDPIVSTHQFGFSLQGVDPNSARFRAAQKACESIGALAGF